MSSLDEAERLRRLESLRSRLFPSSASPSPEEDALAAQWVANPISDPLAADPELVERIRATASDTVRSDVVDVQAAIAPHLPLYHASCRVPPPLRAAQAFNLASARTLCRFLAARDWDVDKAEAMVQACLAFRAELGVDGMLCRESQLESFWLAHAPVAHYHHDKLGRPVVIERNGRVRPYKILKTLDREDFRWRHALFMEICMLHIDACRQRFGNHVTQHVVIFDFKGMTFRPDPNALPLFKQTVQLDQDYYPETLGDLFIINAPAIFTTLWPIAKRFIDGKTRGKFHVLGSNYAKELLRYIDADKLPTEYGGSCTEPIPAQTPWPADWTPPPVEERRAVQPAPEEWLAASGGERTSSAASDAAVSDDDGGAAAQRCGAAPAFLASLYETEPVQVTAV